MLELRPILRTHGACCVLYLLAIILPPIALFGAGKPFQGLLSIVLMITIIGWIPALVSG